MRIAHDVNEAIYLEIGSISCVPIPLGSPRCCSDPPSVSLSLRSDCRRSAALARMPTLQVHQRHESVACDRFRKCVGRVRCTREHGNMDRSGHQLHCILNLLRLCDRPSNGDCVGDMIVVTIMLTAGQEIGSVGPGASGEPLERWLGRRQRLRKPLENAWLRVDEGVRSD